MPRNAVSIKPIIEFYPIEHAKRKKFEIMPTDKEKFPYNAQVKKYLEQSIGIYVFYNAEGKVLYVGKTEKGNLWKEINNVFSRKREAKKIKAVEHLSSGDFKPAFEKQGRIKKMEVRLHKIVAYFSAYSIENPLLIRQLEDFLTRVLPNDLINKNTGRLK